MEATRPPPAAFLALDFAVAIYQVICFLVYESAWKPMAAITADPAGC